jgi:tetratricopeptide (TPR) repeat protein
MGSGPLDHPRLLEIEDKLDRAEIDAAQRLLADLGDVNVHRTAITYFATRLLYQRGRLDPAGVAIRLRELMVIEPIFPQASAMLAAAERGTLRPDRVGFQRSIDPDAHSGGNPRSEPPALLTWTEPARADSSAPVLEVEVEELDTEVDELGAPEPSSRREPDWDQRAEMKRSLSMPEIPRAPMMPRFAPPTNMAPSYAPAARTASLQFELELEQPEAPRDTIRQSEPEPPPSSTDGGASQPSTRRSFPSDRLDATVRDHGPESMLARARALWEQGVHERALAHVGRLEHAPLLEPELRAACARFLIEAGEPERAVVQARRASQDDPDSPLALLMLGWALIRSARHAPNHQVIDDAELVLSRLRTKPAPNSALAQALRAVILAEKGDAERAISTAKLALKLDPSALDAEAAISLAAARLGRFDEAQAAWDRLHALSAEEAERLGDRLQQLGVPLHDSRSVPSGAATSAVGLWDRVEIELFSGERARAVAAFELGAARELRGLVGESATDAIPLLATMAAAFFTTEPVWRHFAPFDLSLGSIARVAAVLDVLYGRAPRALTEAAFPAQVMLATYVGECLRQGYGGSWQGSLAHPETVFVATQFASFAPFRQLRLRLLQGKPLLFEGAEGQRARVSGAPIAMPVAPPAPWDPAPWPSPRMLPRLSLAFSQSVVELYCAEFGGGPLDRKLSGLHALDTYTALLAPEGSRAAADARWVQRASLLVGAYLGEVVREATGAAWRDVAEEAPTGPDSYALILPDGGSAYPVLQAFERLSGQDTAPLSRYATRLVRELG